MKQDTRVWNYGIPGQGSLSTFVDSLIAKGYTIISITTTKFDTIMLSKDHYQVIEALILLCK